MKRLLRNGALAAAVAASITLSAAAAPTATDTNLVQDPTFESSTSGFVAQDSSSSVTLSSAAPLEGARSLRVAITGYGNNVWWTHEFAGKGSSLSVSARLRSDVSSTSDLHFCAMAYYIDQSTSLACTTVTGSAGDKGRAQAEVALDRDRQLASVRIRMYQEGGMPVTFTLDEAAAYLTVVSAPPSPAPGPSAPTPSPDPSTPSPSRPGPSSPAPSTTAACGDPVTSSRYTPAAYRRPATRPFISLAHYTQVDRSSETFTRFRNAVDSAVAGNPPYAYSARDSVIMFELTGSAAYIGDAINRVESFVSAAEAAVAAGGVPAVAGDSYLEVGTYLEQLSLTFDAGYDRLTTEQRQRWSAFAEQTLQNLWNPNAARWGNVSRPWSGWALCDPGNNYHFSFVRATMLWGLASQNSSWISYLQTRKFPALVDYYADMTGGGSREGTGYGTAQKSLFENYLYWLDSTGEDLAGLTTHARDTIDYWVHATVPTRDRFAPIGDQSRSSLPELYDYHENLVHADVVLNEGSPQARRGTWWLQNNSVQGASAAFNLYGDLLRYPDAPQQPSDLAYRAEGAGVLFARTNWATDSAWLSIVAGKYDQSHAHQDQGAFTFFRRDWLAVTQNIWSHSGIHQEVDVHNVLRFERADGTIIPQTPSDTLQSDLTWNARDGLISATANLANAYWRARDAVQDWTRSFEFSGNTLRVSDSCVVAPGVRAVFQVQVPSQPIQLANGSIRAGNLLIVPLQSAQVAWTAMTGDEFSRGYRIDFTSANCSFAFDLTAQ